MSAWQAKREATLPLPLPLPPPTSHIPHPTFHIPHSASCIAARPRSMQLTHPALLIFAAAQSL